jgi:hypothetical protein
MEINGLQPGEFLHMATRISPYGEIISAYGEMFGRGGVDNEAALVVVIENQLVGLDQFIEKLIDVSYGEACVLGEAFDRGVRQAASPTSVAGNDEEEKPREGF